jgi:hypothetical protein
MIMGMREILRTLITGEAPTRELPDPPNPPNPIDRALVDAATARSVGEAFLAGYQTALRALVPGLPESVVVCLCATEEGGAHPRAITTALRPDGDGFRLSGRKKWVTGGTQAKLLLVVASVGADERGRNRLRLARVEPRQPGVAIVPMPPTPFTPEIPHAEVRFDEVRLDASALLEGDGYDRYLKPFRTVEDAHVHGAVLAWLLGVAHRHRWPGEARERLLAIVIALRAIALADPSAPETHLALAGAIELARRAIADTRDHWSLVEPEERARWQRDQPLLAVAERARVARTEAAWKAFPQTD